MCLIVFAWQPDAALPLVAAANRDEFHARPCQPLAEWAEVAGLYAGRDLLAGGTWMGVTASGRFAAITNIRNPGQALGRQSRGTLPLSFLRGEEPPLEHVRELVKHCDEYTGFNLLVGDGQELAFLNAHERQPRLIEPGIHALSNGGLNTPWPKALRARNALEACLPMPEPEQLLALLSDRTCAADEQLPATGVSLARERMLSSIFIHSADYGTRASSAVRQRADGSFVLIERSFDAAGRVTGEVRIDTADARRERAVSLSGWDRD